MKKYPLRFIQSLIITITVLFSHSMLAAEDAIYTGYFNNNAISGYDAVAYFKQGEAIEGQRRFSMSYQGANWRFTSQANLDLFMAAPQAYAPQYGGYCAYAMAEGKLVSSDPEAWTIHAGKLYLNYSNKIRNTWSERMLAYIVAADGTWAEVGKNTE